MYLDALKEDRAKLIKILELLESLYLPNIVVEQDDRIMAARIAVQKSLNFVNDKIREEMNLQAQIDTI